MSAAAGVTPLTALSAADAASVGGKAANLAELIRAGFPVPPGFVVPASSYLAAMEAAGVRGELAELHNQALGAADDPTVLAELCAQMAELVRKAGVPAGLAEEIRAAYRRLPGERPSTAVRSSAVGEDGADDSFAGMNATGGVPGHRPTRWKTVSSMKPVMPIPTDNA